jgi:large conductance mechanosensitive channel
MPPIGMILGKVDFKNLFIALDGKEYVSLAEAEKAGAPVIKYGVFLTDLVTFIILGFIIFLFIKLVNKFKKAEEKKPAPKPAEVKLLEEIRDLLAQSV